MQLWVYVFQVYRAIQHAALLAKYKVGCGSCQIVAVLVLDHLPVRNVICPSVVESRDDLINQNDGSVFFVNIEGFLMSIQSFDRHMLPCFHL
jgi:hypothetical protein